jgi:LuxR family transcriptional regulator of csgAB operon
MATIVNSTFTVSVISPIRSRLSQSLCHLIQSTIAAECFFSQKLKPKQQTDLIIFNRQEQSACSILADLQILNAENKTQNCLIINLERTEHDSKLVEWPQVKGVFYTDCNQEKIAHGAKKILEGHIWLPRDILNEFIKNKRRPPKQLYTLSEENTLTKREKQVLELISQGKTNKKIAETLFISEFTIKSHLYNIYQKLGVSTRLEASNWFNEYMAHEI